MFIVGLHFLKDMKSTSKKYLLEKMNAVEVKKTMNSDSIVFVILGSCENHGDHLPFGSDSLFPLNLAQLMIDDIVKIHPEKEHQFIILPPIPYGVSIHHIDFQMTISLQGSTMISIVEDVLSCLANNGVRRVIILNGHDGNIAPAESAARNVKHKFPEMVISCLESWWTMMGTKDSKIFDVWSGLGHGGEAETSAMMSVCPDLVDLSLAPEQTIPNLPGEDVRIYWKFNELTKTGATGAPKTATVQKGNEIIKILTKVILEFIEKMDTNNWKYGISVQSHNT